jgi:hypothetical protein
MLVYNVFHTLSLWRAALLAPLKDLVQLWQICQLSDALVHQFLGEISVSAECREQDVFQLMPFVFDFLLGRVLLVCTRVFLVTQRQFPGWCKWRAWRVECR